MKKFVKQIKSDHPPGMAMGEILVEGRLCSTPGFVNLMTVSNTENDETLVDLGISCPNILCQYNKLDMLPIVGKDIFVRSSVAQRLSLAASCLDILRPGFRLKVV